MDSGNNKQEEDELRRIQIVERFKNSTFEELMARYDRKVLINYIYLIY